MSEIELDDKVDEAYEALSSAVDDGTFTNFDVVCACGLLLATLSHGDDGNDIEMTFKLCREVADFELKRNCDA